MEMGSDTYKKAMPLYDEDRFSINKNSSIGREMLRKNVPETG
jgi:hypothetical protein